MDVLFDLLLEEGGRVGMLHFIMDEGDVEHVLKHPLSMIGSDGSSLRPEGPLGRGKPHPPQLRLLPPRPGPLRPRAAPALPGGGRAQDDLRPRHPPGPEGKDCCGGGWTPTWSSSIPRPCATRPPSPSLTAAERVRHVIVDGTLTVRDGEHTGSRAGRVLRRG